MKLLAAFASGAIIGAGYAAILLHSGSQPAVRQLEELRRSSAQQATEIEKQRQEIVAQNAAIHRLHTETTELSRLPAPSPTPAKTQGPLAGLADLMDNPAMKKMMAVSQQKVIEDNYADLADALHLAPEERAKFLELLAAKQSIDMDFGMQILKATPEERKKMYESKKAKEDRAEADIREFLNSDADFATYKDYTEQIPQRMQLQAMQPAFERIGQPLDTAKKNALLDIMRTAGKAQPASTPDMSDPTLSANDNARMMAEEQAKQQRIATAAAAILTPQQLQVLKEKQAANLQMLTIGLEMEHTMLGDDPDKSPPKP